MNKYSYCGDGSFVLRSVPCPWLDFSELGLTYKEVSDLILNKAKVWLDEGEIFGEGGRCFQRIAYACQRSTLEEGLNRIKKALES